MTTHRFLGFLATGSRAPARRFLGFAGFSTADLARRRTYADAHTHIHPRAYTCARDRPRKNLRNRETCGDPPATP